MTFFGQDSREAVVVGTGAQTLITLLVNPKKEGYEVLSSSDEAIAVGGVTLRQLDKYDGTTVFGVVWAPSADEDLVWSWPEPRAEVVLCCPLRGGQPTRFEPQFAAWCVTQGFEYVFLGDDFEDGIPRMKTALRIEEDDLPVAAVVGEGAASVVDTLRRAFPSPDPSILRIDTKYYDARVRLRLGPGSANVEALVLVAGNHDDADDLWLSWSAKANVQTKILVSSPDLDAWSLERGFERIDVDDLGRIQHSFQCTLWSTMDRKDPSQRHVDVDDDDLEDLLAIVNEARGALSRPQSDEARRDRAADVALRLARSLGIDSDDES